MNELRPGPDSTLAEAALWIRTVCPILGGAATDEECRVRVQLVAQTLQMRSVEPGDSRWFTAQLSDGRVAGRFADSPEEAELEISIWWAQSCAWVVDDSEYRVYEEYFPQGKRAPKHHARTFPLAAPRRPRDRFAPAASLLEVLDLDEPTSGGPASTGGLQ